MLSHFCSRPFGRSVRVQYISRTCSVGLCHTFHRMFSPHSHTLLHARTRLNTHTHTHCDPINTFIAYIYSWIWLSSHFWLCWQILRVIDSISGNNNVHACRDIFTILHEEKIFITFLTGWRSWLVDHCLNLWQINWNNWINNWIKTLLIE